MEGGKAMGSIQNFWRIIRHLDYGTFDYGTQ
jgi:hypothetical protein